MFFNETTGEYEVDFTDRMKKYIWVEVKAAIVKALISFKNYSCVLVKHSENYNKLIS